MVNTFYTPVPDHDGSETSSPGASAPVKDCLSNATRFLPSTLHGPRASGDDRRGLSSGRLRPDRKPLQPQQRVPIWPRTPRTIQNLMKAICRPFRVTRHKRRMTTEELATERRHNGGTGVDQQARGCERDPVWHTFLRAVQAQEPTLGIERGRHG